MSIITDLKESKALAEGRRQPGIHFLSFSVPSLLRKIQDELFPDITHRVHVYFVTNGPLACIDEEEDQKASINVPFVSFQFWGHTRGEAFGKRVIHLNTSRG